MNDDDLHSNMTGGARSRRTQDALRTLAARKRNVVEEQKAPVTASIREASAPSRETSATGSFDNAVAGWKASLQTWIDAINAYAKEVGTAGERTIGARWKNSLRAVSGAQALLETIPVKLPDIEIAMRAGDIGEQVGRELEAATTDILDPNIRHNVMVGMSRTYSNSLKRLTKDISSSAAETASRLREVLAAAANKSTSKGLTGSEISKLYKSVAIRGSVATELYMSTLLCADQSSALIELEAAKNTSLGLSNDSSEIALADAKTLADYHPLQTMCYTPAPFGETDMTSASIDLTLKNANMSVTYDIRPLIDQRYSAKFGTLAATSTGINYRLVERLRTIRAEPLVESKTKEEPFAALQDAGEPLLVTDDNGATIRSLGARDITWAPTAGARPYVYGYNTASSVVILDAVRAERRDGWGLELHQQFEEKVLNEEVPSGVCGGDALIKALLTEFGTAYDANPPENVAEFRKLVIPKDPGPGTYICAAASRLGSDALNDMLKGVLLAGSSRVPYKSLEHEAHLTQTIHSLNLATALWRQIRVIYQPAPEAFELPLKRRRATLMQLMKRIGQTIVQNSKTSPLMCAPPTLKLYAART